MNSNKEKINALIKRFFNVEYYNLKSRIISSLDEIAKSDNATRNFQINIENAIKENKHDVRDFDKIVIDVFKTLKKQDSNYDYESNTNDKTNTKYNFNNVENKIRELEKAMKETAQQIREAKLDKNDELYAEARSKFSSLVKEINDLKGKDNLQQSTVYGYNNSSNLFNSNDNNLPKYSSDNKSDNPITSDENTNEEIEELDLDIDENKNGNDNDLEETDNEMTDEEKKKARKQKIKKAAIGALGGTIGFGLSFVFQPGTAGTVISVGRLVYSTAKKGLKVYTEKHKDDENNKIIKMVGKVKEFTKEQAEKHPKITSAVVKVNNFLKKPETQIFLNGMAAGYTIGKISQAVYKMHEAAAAEKTGPVDNNENIRKDDIGDNTNSNINPNDNSINTSGHQSVSTNTASNTPSTTTTVPTTPDPTHVFDPTKPVDLSSIKEGYVSSYSSNPVSLITSAGKNAMFDKINVVDGKTWVHFTQGNGAGYAWFPADEVLKALDLSDISELTGEVSGGMHL